MQRKLLLSIGLILVGFCFRPAIYAQSASANTGEIYGGLWEVGPTTSTGLTLKAHGGTLTATILVYSSNGSQLATHTAALQAGQSTQINLATLVAGSGQGGLAVQWSGSGWVQGLISILGDNGINVAYPLQSGNRFDTENSLYAPWYLPDGGTGGSLSLFNSGTAATQVEVSVIVAGTEKQLQSVSLQPNAEQALDLRSLLENANLSQANMGAIVLSYTGTAHTLHPTLFLEDHTTGFSLMPAFAAKHSRTGQNQTVWHYPYVPLPIADPGASGISTSITSYALVANGAGQQQAAQFRSYAVVSGRSVQTNLDIPALAPYETRLINLGTSQPPWISAANPPQTSSPGTGIRFNPAGITITHSGEPGDVAISIFTVGASGQVTGISDGIVLPTNVTDVGYLNTALRNPVKYGVKNATQSTAVTLYYQDLGGVNSYTAALPTASNPTASNTDPLSRAIMAVIPEEAGSRAGVDLANVFRIGSKDANANVLPAGVSVGMLVLGASVPDPSAIKAAQPTCQTTCDAPQTSFSEASASNAKSASEDEPAFSENDYVAPTPCLYTNAVGYTDCVSNRQINVYPGEQISIDAVVPIHTEAATQEWIWYEYSLNTLEQPTDYALGCNSSFSYAGTPCSGTDILNATTSAGYKTSNFPLPADPSDPNWSADSSGSNYTFYWVYPPPSTGPPLSVADYILFYKYSYGGKTGYAYLLFNVEGFSVTSGTSPSPSAARKVVRD